MHDRTRFLVATIGIAFASFLIAVQGGLLFGFTLASSRLIDAIDADVWIVSRGAPALDFVSPIPERYRSIAMGVPGVIASGRGASTWAPFRKANGEQVMVFVVGMDASFLGWIPDPRRAAAEVARAMDGLVVDITDAGLIGVPDRLGHHEVEVEVAGRRATVVYVTQGLSSFLGTPIVVTAYRDAKWYLSLDDEDASFLLVQVAPGSDPEEIRDMLRERLTDVDIWTKKEFSWRSRVYWLAQTGAGGALTLAAVLGFLIGLVVVSQTIYAVTVEYLEEFATLKAMGASNQFVRQVILIQSLICGFLGLALGLLLVEPFVGFARSLVTWAIVPWWMYPAVFVLVLALCILGAVVASAPALTVEPGKVFRA